MKLNLLLFLAFSLTAAYAQDPYVERYGTPEQKAKAAAAARATAIAAANQPQDLRLVDGKLYDASRSVLWKPFEGECLRVLSAGVLILKIKSEPIYTTITADPPIDPKTGLPVVQLSGTYRAGPFQYQSGVKKTPGKEFLLRNYPLAPMPTTGKALAGRALRVGTTNVGPETIELWDYGTRYVPRSP